MPPVRSQQPPLLPLQDAGAAPANPIPPHRRPTRLAPPLNQTTTTSSAAFTTPPMPQHDHPSSSEEEVDSNGSRFRSDPNPHNLATGTWMPEGDMAFASCFAYAFAPAELPIGQEAATIIGEAILAVGHRIHFTTFRTSRDSRLVRFDGPNERDFVVESSPIAVPGGRVHFQRSEKTDNCYSCPAPWLAALSVTDFPLEQWNPEGIRAVLRCLGTVEEIDPECLSMDDFSAARVVVAMAKLVTVPSEPWLTNPGPDGLGSVVQVHLICRWRLKRPGSIPDPFFVSSTGPPIPPAHRAHELQPHLHPPSAPSGPGATAGRHRAGPSRYYTAFIDAILHAALHPCVTVFTPKPLTLPIIIPANLLLPHINKNASTLNASTNAKPLLLLKWQSPAPAQPPSPAATAPPTPRATPPRQGGRRPRPSVTRKRSARLANKEPAMFVDMTTRAMQLTAFKNSIDACSKELKTHVGHRKLLHKRNPLQALDLKKLASSAGLQQSGIWAVTVATGCTKRQPCLPTASLSLPPATRTLPLGDSALPALQATTSLPFF